MTTANHSDRNTLTQRQLYELKQKCVEYSAMGVKNIWVVNPQRRDRRDWQGGARTETSRFVVESTDIHLDIDWLFGQIDSYEE